MNQLQNQVSPYLLQHKNNPVNWYPWGDLSLNKAISEDKPIILSIGYAACHWCHVMEHESFEDEQVADLMNANFVCIKVDREERPDIDLIYMDSIHAMGLHGGWPLNVFLMPDQKPFYGGTYFPKANWMQLLHSITNAFREHRSELQTSADGFAENLNDNKVGLYPIDLSTINPILFHSIERIKTGLDPVFGGTQKAPKFPIPSFGLLFEKLPSPLLVQTEIESLVDLQLTKMALGGIFDQVGGGFSRYSVDSEWFCPHFEKMLYDNGQLVRVYALAYQRTKNPLYLEVVQQTVDFLQKELLGENGLYYASIDADSEGIEGKFYVWTFEELNQLLPYEKHQAFYQAYSLSKMGNWEHGNNILFRKHEVCNSLYQIELDVLKKVRQSRVRPGTDDKQLLSWNAYLAIALLESGRILKDSNFQKLGGDLLEAMVLGFVHQDNKQVLHQITYSDKPIIAFLDDLASLGLALIQGYLIDGNKKYVQIANFIIEQIELLHIEQNNLYNFHSNANESLIAPKFEIVDSVCPSANSMVCEFYLWLGFLNSDAALTVKGRAMLAAVIEQAQGNPIYFANWLRIHSEWIENPQAIIKYNPTQIPTKDVENLTYLTIPTIDLDYAALVCIGDHCLSLCNSMEDLKKLVATI
ncbi:MAG: hypothetical protein RL638_633 [Bacteroidota bacterium]|jgi:uncharacterized protein YyaL (SSP411 family)